LVKVRLIEPVTPGLLPKSWVETLRAQLPQSNQLDCVSIRSGPRSIETATDEEQALSGTIEQVHRAEQEACDAVVIACVGDVAVAESRKTATIPIIGPGEAAMQLAGAWGGRFAIIVANEAGEPSMRDLCKRYGTDSQLASIRWLGLPIVDLADDEEHTAEVLGREGVAAVLEDGADTLIIGCTLASSAEEGLTRHLNRRGMSVRVIDPLRWSVAYACAVAAYGTSRP
jgi:allantoin racemase